MKFDEKTNKNALFKNRIFLILNHKFEEVKKYLNEHLKKKFIVFNHALFALFILFIKKLNERLRFYVNDKKLNAIIKKNRNFISLINKILLRIHNCKYSHD